MVGDFAATTDVLSHPLSLWDWVGAGAIFAVGVLIGWGARLALNRRLRQSDDDGAASNAVARLVSYAIALAGLVYALSQLGVRLAPLIGALGIGGLAIAFAAQSILSNFLASIILQLRRPFRRNDQITTNGIDGIVQDVNFRTIAIRTYEGERVYVPCAQVLANPITNHTALGRRRTTLDVGVGYDTDLERAREVILAAVSEVDGVLPHPKPEVWVQSFGDSAVDLAVRYWHAPETATLWRVRSGVAIAVKGAVDEAGIDLPFPHRVVEVVGDGQGEGQNGSGRNGARAALDDRD